MSTSVYKVVYRNPELSLVLFENETESSVKEGFGTLSMYFESEDEAMSIFLDLINDSFSQDCIVTMFELGIQNEQLTWFKFAERLPK